MERNLNSSKQKQRRRIIQDYGKHEGQQRLHFEDEEEESKSRYEGDAVSNNLQFNQMNDTRENY